MTETRPLIDTLYKEPEGFGFFQAVSILERAGNREAIGRDGEPRRETVRFRAAQTRGFPGTELVALKAPPPERPDDPPEMTVSFLGLTGASGVLPLHYTDTVIEATRRNRNDPALRDFFDLFNHRATSLFFRAWEKYRLPAAYALAPEGRDDPITATLFALTGFGTPALRNRLALDDETLLRYAGLLSHRPRSAAGLEAMLADDLERPVSVQQFRGGWLEVSPEEQTRLPDRNEPDGRFCQLGVNAVAGDRVWDAQSAFRIRLGPLRYHDFLAFLPNCPLLARVSHPTCLYACGILITRVAHLTRLYVGPAMSFDLQLVLDRTDVPALKLGNDDGPEGPRLGRNCWLKGAEFTSDADDAVFSLDHIGP